MTEEQLPENSSEENKDDNQLPEGGVHPQRRRRRVRKRIRIKKKSSPKRKMKKLGERLLWILIIGGFIAALVIMVNQLNIVDEKEKIRKSRAPAMNIYVLPVLKSI
jgi:hypothetical protein